jgi:hypothetical protein
MARVRKQRILHKGMGPKEMQTAIAKFVEEIDAEKAWRLTVEELSSTRSTAQNSFLWGVCYPAILEGGADALQGWQATDLHEFFLGEMWGWETVEGFGRKRMRPVRRSSTMTKTEFADYISFIEQRALDMGIVIPEPLSIGD